MLPLAVMAGPRPGPDPGMTTTAVESLRKAAGPGLGRLEREKGFEPSTLTLAT